MTIDAFSGFETGTAVSEGMFSAGSVTFDTGTKRTGTYSLKVAPSASNNNYLYIGTQAANTQGQQNIGRDNGTFTGYIYITSAPSVEMEVVMGDLGAYAFALFMNTDRTVRLKVYNAGWSTIGSASSALATSTWHRIDFTLNNTTAAGANQHASFSVNGSQIASTTTANAQVHTNISRWYLGNTFTSGSYTVYWDDVVAYSGTTVLNYAPEVNVFKPNASGGVSDMTGSYTDADDIPADGSTTKLSSATSTATHTFNMETVSSSVAGPKAVMVTVATYYDATYSVTPQMRPLLRISSTNYGPSNYKNMQSSWSGVDGNYGVYFWETNPATSSPFTVSELDSIECGFQSANGTRTTGTMYLTSVIMQVLDDPAANTAPSFSSQPSVNYNSTKTRTSVNNTPITISFTPSDPEQTGSGAISYTVRTASGGGGTQVGSGTCTSGANKDHSLAYNDTGMVNGSNTLYVRLSDGIVATDSNSFVVLRDDTAPNSATIISYG